MANGDAQESPIETISPEPIQKEDIVSTKQETPSAPFLDANKLGILNDVAVTVTIEIGRAEIKIRDLLNLTKDSIIDLDKLAGEPVDIFVNGKLISKGNIITANGKYCVRLLSIPGNGNPQ